MSATLKDLNHHPSAQLKSVLLSLRSSPKIALAIAAAATLSVVIALVMWANQQSYSILLSNISDEDGGAIVAQLTQLNVPYRIDASSGAIRVPEGQVHEVRMKLAQQGLPKGGAVGFELLDQEKFGISQFSEQVNFQRALEGELSRTIENLGRSSRRACIWQCPNRPCLCVSRKRLPPR
jgi:Flagellar biosynthesis/type III secretory pathway lipoprotein